MTFLHPEFLYLMLPAVLVLFYFLLTQRESTSLFFSEEVFEKLRVKSGVLSLRIRNVLFLMMFICFIVALAQPVMEAGRVKVEAKSADIMIALDISDSMRADDIYPSRIERAKEKIITLLDASPQERLGVSAFAKASYLVAPLSFDHRAVHYLVKRLETSHITEQGTDFMELLRSTAVMMKENRQKYLLILTDGGDQSAFDAEIAYAKEQGMKVFILGLGTEKGAPIRTEYGDYVKYEGNIVVTRLNDAISQFATETGGVYIESVNSNEDIRTMLREITAKTTKRTLKEEEIVRYTQFFYIPLGLGMLLFLIATSSMSRRQRVQPPMVLALGIVCFSPMPSQGGILDFQLLDQAKAAYEGGDYNRSATLYDTYAQRHPGNASLYNAASAHYKNGAFQKAVKAYEKVKFPEAEQQFDALHNLGNAYAKSGNPEGLKKAIETYEKALEIEADPLTQENLEIVKKLLEQEQKKPQNQGNQGQEDSQQKEDDKEGKQEPGETPQEEQSPQEKASQQEQQEQEQSSQNSAPKEDQEQQDETTEASEPQEDPQAGDGKQKQPEDTKKTAPKEEEEAPRTTQKSASETEEETEPEEPASDAEQPDGQVERGTSEEHMSDLEAQKWLKALREGPATHIYKISPETTERKENTHEKPW